MEELGFMFGDARAPSYELQAMPRHGTIRRIECFLVSDAGPHIREVPTISVHVAGVFVATVVASRIVRETAFAECEFKAHALEVVRVFCDGGASEPCWVMVRVVYEPQG